MDFTQSLDQERRRYFIQSNGGIALPAAGALYWLARRGLAGVIGWLFGSRICLLHALSRAILVTGIWYLFPSDRFTLIPLVVAFLYGLTTWGLHREVSRARREYRTFQTAHTEDAPHGLPT